MRLVTSEWWLRCWLFSLALAGAVTADRSARSEGILGPVESVSLPDPGIRPRGFTLRVDVGRESSVAYVPVRITFQAIGTLTADRRLDLRFETLPGGETPPRNGMTIELPLTIAEGIKTQTFVRYLPKWSAGQAVAMSVREEGRQLEGYTALIGGELRSSRRFRELLASEYRVNWVLVRADDDETSTWDKFRDLLMISQVVAEPKPWLPAQEVAMLAAQTRDERALQVILPEDLPEDWRGYQRYDAVVIDTAGLQRVQDNEAAFAALRLWVLSGGTLVLFPVQSPAETLDAIHFRWTDDPAARTLIESITPQISGWLDALERQLLEGPTLPREEPVAPRVGPGEIWMQRAGAGNVIGIQCSAESSALSLMHLHVVSQLIGFYQSPMIRRGVDPMLGDRRFSRWLIPGVAEPPVYTFMGLLTAFVVLVGPLAYRRTSRHGRGYLMFAIAPLLALVTTVAMFGYGIVSDGFGTVARVRQLTWVDGRSGDACERVRATYFAGVRPSAGLRFPADAEVISYPDGGGEPWEQLHQRSPASLGSLRIDSRGQTFDSAFLPSRQQRQFVVHRPRPQLGYLRLTWEPDVISPPSVENGFDFAVRQLVMRDAAGVYWTVAEVGAGQSVRCSEMATKNASRSLGQLYNDFRPLSRVRETSRAQRTYDNRIYDVLVDTNREIKSGAVVTDGVFELWLQNQLQTAGEIPVDHFIGISDISPEVLSVAECELSASVHYVFGTLR